MYFLALIWGGGAGQWQMLFSMPQEADLYKPQPPSLASLLSDFWLGLQIESSSRAEGSRRKRGQGIYLPPPYFVCNDSPCQTALHHEHSFAGAQSHWGNQAVPDFNSTLTQLSLSGDWIFEKIILLNFYFLSFFPSFPFCFASWMFLFLLAQECVSS